MRFKGIDTTYFALDSNLHKMRLGKEGFAVLIDWGMFPRNVWVQTYPKKRLDVKGEFIWHFVHNERLKLKRYFLFGKLLYEKRYGTN